MIELDGVEYPIKTPDENVQDLVSRINTYCTENSVKNKQGDLIQIEANEANPLYMMCYGLAYMLSDLQKLVYSAGCSMSLNESSERQLLNLADIANVQRKDATKTTVIVTIYANLTPTDSDEEAVPCVVTTSDTAEVPYGDQVLYFHPAYETTIPVDGVATMTLICEQEGSFNLSENAITNFNPNPAGFRRMTSKEANPGQDQETIAALRQRLQYRDTSYTMIDAAILAIDNLDGVSSCNIYFNYSTTTTENVNGVDIPPRKAMVIVQGFSNEIAETFYKNLSCEVVGEGDSRAESQPYETLAGQSIPFYIYTPNYVPVYIRVYMKGSYTTEEQQNIKDTICGLASSMSVAQELSSVDVINVLTSTYPSFNVQGVQLALSSEEAYLYKVTPGSDELITFNTANIELYIDSGETVDVGSETEPGPEEEPDGDDEP